MLNYDLKMIKDKYGEKMMHFCREPFANLLEKEGLLFSILSEHFAYSKLLYDDIVSEYMEEEFIDYILSFTSVKKDRVVTNKSPKELLSEAGYDLYECYTEKDIQKFRKYYDEDEVICTIKDGGRLRKCFVFFAVKKDVDSIKRKDFKQPKRQDKYGTSVISIQFRKGSNNSVSIKNRYNHTVENPDATFSNNLDAIILGLTDAFEKEYGLNINSNNDDFELEGYYRGTDGKHYKVNYEINDICYCANNVILDHGKPIKVDKAKYIIADCFIIDKVNKKIFTLNKELKECFIDSIGEITKPIREEYDKVKKERTIIINDDIRIVLDRYNRIIKYSNPNIEEIGDHFLDYNRWVEEINIPNVKKIGDDFLRDDKDLLVLKADKLEEVGNNFLFKNDQMRCIDFPNLVSVGDCFMHCSQAISLNLPKLKRTKNYFMSENKKLSGLLYLPEIEFIGRDFLYNNENITELDFPKVEKILSSFMSENRIITSVKMPNLKSVDFFFLSGNRSLKELCLESLENVGELFLRDCVNIESIYLPKAKTIGRDFCYRTIGPLNIYLPEVEEIGPSFLSNCEAIDVINFPKVKKISRWFVPRCRYVKEVILPEACDINEEGFLRDTDKRKIKRYYVPKYKISIFENLVPKYIKELKLTNKSVNFS